MHKKTSVAANGLIWFGAGVSIAEILTGTYFAGLGFGRGLAAILLGHIGYKEEADRLDEALYICSTKEKKVVLTGRDTGATSAEYADYIMETLESLQ